MLLWAYSRKRLVDEIFGQIEIALFSGGTIKFDQRELDLLVAGIAARLPRSAPEGGGDQIGITAHRVEEFTLPRRVEVRHGGLDQMPGAVKFVVAVKRLPAVLGFDVGEVRVEITVGLLGADYEVDQLVEELFPSRRT